MKNRNTLSGPEFIYEHFLWAAIAYVWFISKFFVRLGSLSSRMSLYVLIGLVVVSCIVGIITDIGKECNHISMFLNVLFAYGVYVCIAYYPTKKRIISSVIIVMIIIVILYFAYVMSRKIRRPHHFKAIIIRRIKRACRGGKCIICVGFVLMMLIIGVDSYVQTQKASESSALVSSSAFNTKEGLITSRLDDLENLNIENWKDLSVGERTEVLQVVADIEAQYLGLNHELKIDIVPLRDGVRGSYSDSDHKIELNIDTMSTDTPRELVRTVAHEAYHGMQYLVVEAYLETREDLKGILYFQDASRYKEDLADYNDGKEDFDEYYDQWLEIKARRYAEDAADEYITLITAKKDCEEGNFVVEFDPTESGIYSFIEDDGWTDMEIARYQGDNGLIGYMDPSGHEITPPKFIYASQMKYGIAMVWEELDRMYYIDQNGQRITPDYMDGYAFDHEKGMARVKEEDGKWAIIDKEGMAVFRGADKIEEFPDLSRVGTAVVDGCAVLLERVDSAGDSKYAVMCSFQDFTDISYLYYRKFAYVWNDSGKMGVVSMEGDILVPAEYEKIEYDYVYSIGLYPKDMICFKAYKEDGEYEFLKFEL